MVAAPVAHGSHLHHQQLQTMVLPLNVSQLLRVLQVTLCQFIICGHNIDTLGRPIICDIAITYKKVC